MSGWHHLDKRTPEQKRERHLEQIRAWQTKHREYYLAQKRELSKRPEYKEHRRKCYHERTQILKDAGILPMKKGRPRLYEGDEAKERKREINRAANQRYKDRKRSNDLYLFSPDSQNDDHTTPTSSESSP